MAKHQDSHSSEPSFFGSATVGERGQIVIPAEARQKLNISAGDKLLIFSSHRDRHSMVVMKAERVTEFVSGAIARLSKLEEIARGEKK